MGETDKDRPNRNLDQLLQELRVVITGVQVLFAFLLAVPFSAQFVRVDPFERIDFFVARSSTGCCSATSRSTTSCTSCTAPGRP